MVTSGTIFWSLHTSNTIITLESQHTESDKGCSNINCNSVQRSLFFFSHVTGYALGPKYVKEAQSHVNSYHSIKVFWYDWYWISWLCQTTRHGNHSGVAFPWYILIHECIKYFSHGFDNKWYSTIEFLARKNWQLTTADNDNITNYHILTVFSLTLPQHTV